MAKEIDKEDYKGPGKVDMAIGSATTNYFIGGVAGGAIGSVVGWFRHDPEKVSAKIVELAEKYGKPAREVSAMRAAGIGAAALAMTGVAVGIFNGWRKAGHAQQQHEELASENRTLAAQNTILEERAHHNPAARGGHADELDVKRSHGHSEGRGRFG